MSLDQSNIGVIVTGYIIAIALSHVIVGPLVGYLWRQYVPSLERHAVLPAIIGTLDIVLYMSSFLMGAMEFIPIWLALKVTGEWRQSQTEVDRPLYHIFLIGNALNVIIGVGSALIIQLLIDA